MDVCMYNNKAIERERERGGRERGEKGERERVNESKSKF